MEIQLYYKHLKIATCSFFCNQKRICDRKWSSREVIWIRNLCSKLTEEDKIITLYVENKSAFWVIKDEDSKKRSRHFNIYKCLVKWKGCIILITDSLDPALHALKSDISSVVSKHEGTLRIRQLLCSNLKILI